MQKLLAFQEALPQPNPAFHRSEGPKVPVRSSLRAIAHNQQYHGLKSKVSKSLVQLGLEAASIPLPDSPPLEADESMMDLHYAVNHLLLRMSLFL